MTEATYWTREDSNVGRVKTASTQYQDGKHEITVPHVKVQEIGVPAAYTGLSQMESPFNIIKGQLNKLFVRPQILNEHAESSREAQGVVTSTNIVGQIFKASQDNINTAYCTVESAAGVTVDNFNSYATSAELQAVWVESNPSYPAFLETSIAVTGNSMRMAGEVNGIEWETTISPTDMTNFTGTFSFYQTDSFDKLKFRVYVGDGTNTKSLLIPSAAAFNWQRFDININALIEDGGGTTNEAAITEIGFRVDAKSIGEYGYVDNIVYTPEPGKMDIELYDMGATIPEAGVTSIDDGTQITQLGDIGAATPLSTITLNLQGGKRIYHIDNFITGVAREIPTNELLTVGNYYAILFKYNDTDVSVYGPNSTYSINYYQNGYAFTAPDISTPITAIGTYNDCMFGIFSTQDVYIVGSSARADAEPNGNSSYSSFVEDSDMSITGVVHSHATNPNQDGIIELWNRPYLMEKGGKFELYYNDDLTDSVSQIQFGMSYVYEPPTVNG